VNDDQRSWREGEAAAAAAPFAGTLCLLRASTGGRGSDCEAGIVHVSLGNRQDESPPADPDDGRLGTPSPLCTQPCRVASRDQAHGLGTGVVAGPLVLGTRVAKPDGEQVGRRHVLSVPVQVAGTSSADTSEQLARSQSSSEAAGGSPPAAASAGSTSGSTSGSRARGMCAIATAASGSTSLVTPSGSRMSDTRKESPPRRGDVDLDDGGDVAGLGLDLQAQHLLVDGALDTVYRLESPIRAMRTSAVTISSRRTTWKSTWSRSGAPVALKLLCDCKVRRLADPQAEQRVEAASVVSAARRSRAPIATGSGAMPCRTRRRDLPRGTEPSARTRAQWATRLDFECDLGHVTLCREEDGLVRDGRDHATVRSCAPGLRL